MSGTIGRYFEKMKGGEQSPPAVGIWEIIWSGIGSFIGIFACAYLTYKYFLPIDLTLIMASFGASAVLIYAAIKSPLAQPRNLIGGHMVSAFVGVTVFIFVGHYNIAISAALAVSLAIMLMHATKTLHPPGGATALWAVIGSPLIHKLGYLFILVPAALGAVVLLVVAIFVNNLSGNRKYPEYWF